ncbi:relaxase [Bifidobacterium lemurum]|uniref:Relaxase n=1 Tax=Bifidobacterium lemurum TaxID=1603886 RepID=A0A261FL39_9BIFI|nr:relaxase [Bifidobacterium lemurum]OZG59892.1 relaxase [Bifidobacterium lemurum]
MIPKISRGSNPVGLVKYLFGKGRHNEHSNQHLVCASGDMLAAFGLDGRPAESFARIGERFDRRYRVRASKDDPFPKDRRGKYNPERVPGKDRVWHCSLSIKAGQGILSDMEWDAIVRDYLKRMNIIQEDGRETMSWVAVRHGLSRNGNDHVHLMVQLAGDDEWYNTYDDRKHAQRSCRGMERERPELIELDRTVIDSKARFKYEEWRRWAEWKAHDEYDGVRPWDVLDPAERTRLIARVAASTMPRHHVCRVVEACAKASHSEDEFIRRVRREGFNIDPRLRKGVAKGSFDAPEQVVGYRITWRSEDGWTERFSAFDLGDDLRLASLRQDWMRDPRSKALAVQEWRASMENRPPVVSDGMERRLENLSTHDMERLIDEAFHIAKSLENKSGDEYTQAMRDGLRTFDRLRERYGLDDSIPANMMQSFVSPFENNEGVVR